jgi:hypothetical protein
MTNQPTFSDPAHPDVSLRNWEMFKSHRSPYSISEVIDRAFLGLEPPVLPLTRGGVVLTDYQFQVLGFQPGKWRGRGWVRVNAGLYERAGSPIEVMVQRLANGLWLILRCDRRTSPLGLQKEAFVHIFGASPVLTRHVKQAIYLAERYGTCDAPRGFRWTPVHPDKCLAAMRYADHRDQVERHARLAALRTAIRNSVHHQAITN